MRHYSLFDQIIGRLDHVIQACSCSQPEEITQFEDNLSDEERNRSASLMRINHSGEVCAQALYLGQALVARDASIATQLYQAAKEEKDHLRWCRTRILELKGRTSYLNPLFAMGSLGIGVLAGLKNDAFSLGFLAETEHQVVEHLEGHLKKISPNDTKSIAIIEKMKEEESQHATHAIAQGGTPLPQPIRLLMRLASKVMTTTTKFI